jgi:hypothetical protein
MKCFICLLSFILAISACQKKNDVVPENVLDNFNKAYLNAENITWEKENGYFEAEFVIDDVEMAVVFDENALIIMTEETIDQEVLPDTIKSVIAADFANHSILEVNRIFKDSLCFYEVELQSEEIEKEIVFSEAGMIVQTTAETEDSEEEENDD